MGTDRDRGNDAVLALSSLLKSAQAHQLIVHLQPLTHSTSHTQLQDSAVLHSACNRHPNLNLNLIPISISSDAHHTSSDKRPQCLLTLITLAYHIYIISHALAHSSTAPCAARAPRPRNISNFREIWFTFALRATGGPRCARPRLRADPLRVGDGSTHLTHILGQPLGLYSSI